MKRIALVAGLFALALPGISLAQPSRDHHRGHRHRDRDRGGVGVGFSVTIGGGHTSVGIRTLPTRHAPVVRRVYPNHGVTILAQRGDYYLVDMGFGRSGWVHCSQLPGYQHRSVTTVIVRQPVILPTPVVIQSNEVGLLDRFEYSNVLEWSGDHEQGHLKLTRQSNGTYLAEVDGEKLTTTRALIRESDVAEIKRALTSMQAFPDHSFAGDGAHFYTTVSAEGTFADGRGLHFSRRFYDPSADRPARLAGELNGAVNRLIARIQAAVAARGITGAVR